MHNHAILTGRFTDTPELRQTASGIPICDFTIAVQRKHSKNHQEQKADFISVEAWNSTAKFVSEYFDKGDLIEITGSLRTTKWKDEEGKTHYKTFVRALEVAFVPTNNRKNDTGNNADIQDSISDSDVEDMSE